MSPGNYLIAYHDLSRKVSKEYIFDIYFEFTSVYVNVKLHVCKILC